MKQIKKVKFTNPEDFTNRHLIPFMLREQGRGFAMDEWIQKRWPGEIVESDGLEREAPACGTVCCIGGSIQALLGLTSVSEAADALDISLEAAEGLFYNWRTSTSILAAWGWPKEYTRRFAQAKTPLQKAKIAAQLVRATVRTKGEILRRAE